nr:MAG TPA: hypothetical protein [Caudoviricetes sp.]
MTNKDLSLRATYSVDDTYDSERFLKLRVNVCHDGENRNKSFITKEALQDALPTIYNTPLLANVAMNQNGELDFGAHDIKIVEDAMNEGQFRLQYVEVPVGVFPADVRDACIVEEDDGRAHMYASAYLWRGYANYAEDIMQKREKSDVSMEILIKAVEFAEEDDVCRIDKFVITGVTLLGADRTPAMEGACASVQFAAEDKDKLMATLVDALTQEFTRKEGDIDLPKNKDIEVMEETVEPIAEESTVEEEPAVEEPVAEEEPAEDFTAAFSATFMQKRQALCGALPHSYDKERGIEVSHYLVDFDDKYVYVERDTWTADTFTQQTGRFEYKFDEATQVAELTSEFELMVCKWLTVDEAEKLEESRNVFTELDELRTYKREKEVANVFAQFPDLVENEQFKALLNDNAKFSVDELQRECYVIRGMAHSPVTEEEHTEAPRIPVRYNTNPDEAAPYGGTFAIYGIQPQNN